MRVYIKNMYKANANRSHRCSASTSNCVKNKRKHARFPKTLTQLELMYANDVKKKVNAWANIIPLSKASRDTTSETSEDDSNDVSNGDTSPGCAINDRWMKQLVMESEELWNIYGGSYDNAKSCWVNATDKPRCALEEFALACGAFHINRLQYKSEGKNQDKECYLGVEYWVQKRNGEISSSASVGAGGTADKDIQSHSGKDAVNPVNAEQSYEDCGLEFHFDKDEMLLKECDKWRHPLVSTATYLDPCCMDSAENIAGAVETELDSTVWGAPLIIFNTVSEDDTNPSTNSSLNSNVVQKSTPSHGWVMLPIPSTHVSFDGNLLHGVPGEIIPKGRLYEINTNPKYTRLSLLVNIWVGREIPRGMSRLPLSYIERYTHYIPCKQYFDDAHMHSMQMQDMSILDSKEEPYRLSEDVPGDTDIIPLRNVKKLIEKNRGVLCKDKLGVSYLSSNIVQQLKSGLFIHY